MSFCAVIDTIIHLESFRNIDLNQQGLYALQFEAFHITKGKKIIALPYRTLSQINPSKSLIISSQIQDNLFFSQRFFIKLVQDEIDLNEVVIFRSEVDITDEKEVPNLTIICNLLYSGINVKINERTLKDLLRKPPQFSIISSLGINVLNFIESVNQFLPIVFVGSEYCLLNTTIHTALIDFRLRFDPFLHNSPHKNHKGCENFTLKTPSQVMFPKGLDLSDEAVNRVHQQYIGPMLISFEKTRKLIYKWGKFCENSSSNINASSNKSSDNSIISENMTMFLNSSLSQRIHERDPETVASQIIADIQNIAGFMLYQLDNFVGILVQFSKIITVSLMSDYNILLKDRFSESIFKKATNVPTFCELGDSKLASKHKKFAKGLRSKRCYQSMEYIRVSVTSYLPSPNIHPIFFVDISCKSEYFEGFWDPHSIKYSYNRAKSNHLIVIVHGFQATSLDVRMIKNQIMILRPDTQVMCSYVNEEETEGDISLMGERLSEEIKQFVFEFGISHSLEKLSFIGHSLGGLIIRASLPHLRSFHKLFYSFITFSTPHLGYMYNSSKIVNAGIWLLKKLKQSLCLKQISMSDSSDPRKTFLYCLSNCEGIEMFKNICFLGSHQDKYSPFESSRVEVGANASKDLKGKLYIEMANNLLSKISAENLYRIDADFVIKNQSIDKIIGRAAHIELIDNCILIQMLLISCTHFFD